MSLIHGVVVEQAQFVTRQAFLGVGLQFVFRHGFVPKACLQHFTFVVVPVIQGIFCIVVGIASETEPTVSAVHALEGIASDDVFTIIETYLCGVLLFVHVEYVGNLSQFGQVDSLIACQFMSVHEGRQSSVCCYTQRHEVAVEAV